MLHREEQINVLQGEGSMTTSQEFADFLVKYDFSAQNNL